MINCHYWHYKPDYQKHQASNTKNRKHLEVSNIQNNKMKCKGLENYLKVYLQCLNSNYRGPTEPLNGGIDEPFDCALGPSRGIAFEHFSWNLEPGTRNISLTA